MEFSSRAAELTTLLESRMTKNSVFPNFQVDEIGRVVSVSKSLAPRGEDKKEAPR